MKKYRWGIIGAGHIAGQFAEDLKLLPNAQLHAIASRSVERASEFASKYDVPVYYGSWNEMSADPDVDIVYVATHHPHHFENTLSCLNTGMAVLCEKPFTMNRGELEELVSTARKNKVFLMEAIWTRFLPSTLKVLEITSTEELGKLVGIYADLGTRNEYDPGNRFYDPAKGGGALLDRGIYPVFLSSLIAGIPGKIAAIADFAPTGIDQSCSMIMEHKDKIISSSNCTFLTVSPNEANLLFESGRIRMESIWITPGPIRVHRDGQEAELIEFPEPGNGYRYEAAEVMRCLDEGMTESTLLPLDFSLELMETLDRIRKICGIRYEQDQ